MATTRRTSARSDTVKVNPAANAPKALCANAVVSATLLLKTNNPVQVAAAATSTLPVVCCYCCIVIVQLGFGESVLQLHFLTLVCVL